MKNRRLDAPTRAMQLLYVSQMAFMAFTALVALVPLSAAAETQTIANYKEVFSYPYVDLLDAAIAATNRSTIRVFAYGSLIDAASASKTLLLETIATGRPAVVFGVKRLFNHDLPLCTPSVAHWGAPTRECARAFLNVEYALSHERVNGVVYDVNGRDMKKLAEREVGYDLIPVPYYHTVELEISATKCLAIEPPMKMHMAYTFSARQPQCLQNQVLQKEREMLQPREGYFELTLAAARRMGCAFHAMFCETTFLADGCTPIPA